MNDYLIVNHYDTIFVLDPLEEGINGVQGINGKEVWR